MCVEVAGKQEIFQCDLVDAVLSVTFASVGLLFRSRAIAERFSNLFLELYYSDRNVNQSH